MAAKLKPCHQCRQAPKDFAATCKDQRKNKPCTLLFCQRCLWNRYGKNAEEAEVLELWSCPKCQGICNCSRCRKAQGLPATGSLFRKAKVAGFSSASDYLRAKNANDTGASLKKRGASSKKEIGASRKKGKENLSDVHVAETIVTESSSLMEIVVTEGTVLDVQLHSTMEVMNGPSEDVIEEVDEASKDVTMEGISSKIAGADSPHKSDENGEAFVDVDSDSSKKQSDDLVAVRNDVDKLTTKVARCRVEANENKDDGDTHGPSGFEGSKRLQDKSLGKLPESESSQPETVKEKQPESRKRRRDATQIDSDVLRMESILDEEVVIHSQQIHISTTSQSSEIQTLTQPERREAEKYTRPPPGIVVEESSNFATSISVEKPAPFEEINAEMASYKLAHKSQAFDQRAHSGVGLAKAKMVEGDNFRLGDDPAPLLEPLSQKHLDKVETAIVVHTMCKGEISGERLIYFLEGGRTMNINQEQLLFFKKQLELEYLVYIMHDRSFVHRRWISNMKTKIRQITGLLSGTKEHFKPKYICNKDGKEREMPYESVEIQHDQLGSYLEYTKSQVGMSSITLDDIDDHDYTPSELRAAYWQITGADDDSVKVKRHLKKALEKAELKLLDTFLQNNPSFREIPDGYELDH